MKNILKDKRKTFYLGILCILLPASKYLIIQFVQGNATDLIPYPDFASHWAATRIALAGLGSEIYNHQAFIQNASHLIPNFIPLPHIHPPTYSVLLSPLANLPFDTAMLIWGVGSILLLGIAINMLVAERIIWLLAMSTPILVWTIVWGQVGCFIAAIFCIFANNFDRRPAIAGFCVALLAIKPHLALLFPLVFAIDRRWHLIFFSAAFLGLFLIISTMLFGASTWLEFFRSGISSQQSILNNYTVWGWENQQSLYGVMRFFGMTHSIAILGHVLFAIGCAAVVMAIWRSNVTIDIKLAVLGAGSVAIIPYCHVHDLAFLVTSCLLLYRHGKKYTYPVWENPIILIAALCPFLVAVGMPGGFLSIILVFFLTVRAAKAATC